MSLALCLVLLLASCAHRPASNGVSMLFARVPVGGPHMIRVCYHEARERDLHAWQPKRWPLTDKPATHVSWHEARAYCAWLTTEHRKTKRILPTMRYRLPTDHEWSCAVGLRLLEDPKATPESKRQNIKDQYPWGKAWPPPTDAGNYLGSEGPRDLRAQAIPGFTDQHAHLAPVLSYQSKGNGIGDLGGNVWEWCEDNYRPGTDWKVLRGAAWNCARPETMLSSHRTFDPPDYKSDTVGFRLVLQ